MGFQFSAVFDIMWNHPWVCGSVLLLLTPSLFHILLYFSPLLISTTLFIIALISMGPRMEETKEERERWANGEKPIASVVEEAWPYADWSQPSSEPIAVKRKSEDGPTWRDFIEEGKNKLAIWIDTVFKSPELKPLVEAVSSSVPTETGNVISATVEKKKTGEVEVLVQPATSTRETNVAEKTGQSTPVTNASVLAAVDEAKSEKDAGIRVPEVAPKQESAVVRDIEAAPQVRVSTAAGEIDMPELETVEAPSLDQACAAEVLPDQKLQTTEPIWDEVPAEPDVSLLPLTDDDLLEVSLHDPVQERVHEEEKVIAKEDDQAASQKHVHFSKDAATIVAPAASARDVHRRILNDLHTQLNELQSKRRNKYSQILSRRMSTKTHNINNNNNNNNNTNSSNISNGNSVTWS